MPEILITCFTLFLTTFVALSITIGDNDQKSKAFWLRTVVLILPSFVLLRQILILTGWIDFFPSYLFVAYVLVRLIAPLINLYCHTLVNKNWSIWHPINLLTIFVFLYILYDFAQFLFLPQMEKLSYIDQSFHKENILATTYPALQLIHLVWAIYVLIKYKVDENDPVFMKYYFIKRVVVFTIGMFLIQQLFYLLPFSRVQLEYYVGSSVLIIIYTFIMIESIRYSSLHQTRQTETQPKLESGIIKDLSELTVRENEVLRYIAKGMTDVAIANEIHLSPATVRTYCRRIFSKLAVKNRAEATAFFLSK